MRRHEAHLVALGAVTAWAVFSYAYLGVEDGSSGLSPLGWLSAVFFLPGGFALSQLKGSHGNADLPLMAVISWITFALPAIAAVRIGTLFARPTRKQPKTAAGHNDQ